MPKGWKPNQHQWFAVRAEGGSQVYQSPTPQKGGLMLARSRSPSKTPSIRRLAQLDPMDTRPPFPPGTVEASRRKHELAPLSQDERVISPVPLRMRMSPSPLQPHPELVRIEQQDTIWSTATHETNPVASWPAHQTNLPRHPPLLTKINEFVKWELEARGVAGFQATPTYTRYSVYQEAFQYLVESFKTYGPVLEEIKAEYDRAVEHGFQAAAKLHQLEARAAHDAQRAAAVAPAGAAGGGRPMETPLRIESGFSEISVLESRGGAREGGLGSAAKGGVAGVDSAAGGKGGGRNARELAALKTAASDLVAGAARMDALAHRAVQAAEGQEVVGALAQKRVRELERNTALLLEKYAADAVMIERQLEGVLAAATPRPDLDALPPSAAAAVRGAEGTADAFARMAGALDAALGGDGSVERPGRRARPTTSKALELDQLEEEVRSITKAMSRAAPGSRVSTGRYEDEDDEEYFDDAGSAVAAASVAGHAGSVAGRGDGVRARPRGGTMGELGASAGMMAGAGPHGESASVAGSDAGDDDPAPAPRNRRARGGGAAVVVGAFDGGEGGGWEEDGSEMGSVAAQAGSVVGMRGGGGAAGMAIARQPSSTSLDGGDSVAANAGSVYAGAAIARPQGAGSHAAMGHIPPPPPDEGLSSYAGSDGSISLAGNAGSVVVALPPTRQRLPPAARGHGPMSSAGAMATSGGAAGGSEAHLLHTLQERGREVDQLKAEVARLEAERRAESALKEKYKRRWAALRAAEDGAGEQGGGGIAMCPDLDEADLRRLEGRAASRLDGQDLKVMYAPQAAQ